MRILVQRIAQGWVEVDGAATAKAGRGLLALVGFQASDTGALLEPMATKLIHLRILADGQGRMNLALADVGGSLVLVSQFTLYADSRQGRRPSFVAAMPPQAAQEMYDRFVARCREMCAPLGLGIVTGTFGAMMQVHLVNDGPVTILLDSVELGLEPGAARPAVG
jgi:D-tyrosyl-tRNA(Tyr) deacylase